MDYPATQRDISMLSLPHRKAKMKVELLSYDNQVLCEMSGEITGGSLTIDAQSDVRRIASISVASIDPVYELGADRRIWYTRQIRLFYCIQSPDGDWIEYPLGIYAYTEASFSLSAEENMLSLSCGDRMVFLLETRGNQIGHDTTILVDSSIRNAMRETLLTFTPIKDYAIEEFPSDQEIVPYDIEKDAGSYPHDLIRELRDLYPCRETFFDVYGTFICRKIPDSLDDPLFLDASVMDPLIISEQEKHGFDVRNVTEIWGADIDADRTAESCSFVDGVYTLTIPLYDAYVNDEIISFTPQKDCVDSQKLRIGELASFPIIVRKYASDGRCIDEPIKAGVIRSGYPYAVRYMDGVFLFEGELTVHAIVKEVSVMPSEEEMEADRNENDCRTIGYVVNPDSPYTVDKIGEIRQVLTGGEYDDITTSQLALERASYENWKKTRLNDGVTLTSVLIPFMEVNKKIEYTSPRTGEKRAYLVKQITMDFASSTMTLELSRFYPYYPWL